MKYTIEGLQQDILVRWKLDGTDAIILRYLIDFYHSRRMYHKIVGNRIFMWVYYQTIINDLPVLGIKSRQMIYLRFKKYADCGLMGRYIEKGVDEYMDDGNLTKRHGTYTYYCFYPDKLTELIGTAKIKNLSDE